MENFRIRLADVVIGVCAEFPETKSYCADFFTEEAPEIELVLTKQDRERARQVHMETDVHEGRTPGTYRDTLLENTALHLRIMDALIERNAVLFHGCAVAVKGGSVSLLRRFRHGQDHPRKTLAEKHPGLPHSQR